LTLQTIVYDARWGKGAKVARFAASSHSER
jgi:hypothetical protein